MNTKKITLQTLNELASLGRHFWMEEPVPRGMDNQQWVVLSYLKAIEIKLKVKFEFDLPRHLEPIREDD